MKSTICKLFSWSCFQEFTVAIASTWFLDEAGVILMHITYLRQICTNMVMAQVISRKNIRAEATLKCTKYDTYETNQVQEQWEYWVMSWILWGHYYGLRKLDERGQNDFAKIWAFLSRWFYAFFTLYDMEFRLEILPFDSALSMN